MVKAGCRKCGLSEETDQLRVEACGKRVKVLSKDTTNFTVSCEVLGVQGEVVFGVESLREADKSFLLKPSVATWYMPVFVDIDWEAKRAEQATTGFLANLYTRGIENAERALADKALKGLSDAQASKEAKKVVTNALEAAAIAGLRAALPDEREEALAEAYQENGATYALDETLRLAKETPSQGSTVISAQMAAAAAIVAKRREGVTYDGSRRHFMTNAGATKKQVANFAHSLTASIFKASKQKDAKRRGEDSLSPPPKKNAGASAAGRRQMAATQPNFTQGQSSPPTSPTSSKLRQHAIEMAMSQSTSFMGRSKFSAIPAADEGDGF